MIFPPSHPPSIHFLPVPGDTGQVASLSRGTSHRSRQGGHLEALINPVCLDCRRRREHPQAGPEEESNPRPSCYEATDLGLGLSLLATDRYSGLRLLRDC